MVASKVNEVITAVAGEEATFTDPELAGDGWGHCWMLAPGGSWQSTMFGRRATGAVHGRRPTVRKAGDYAGSGAPGR